MIKPERNAVGRRGKLVLLTLGVLSLLGAAGHTADEPRWPDYFGFLPIEVYKLDNRINGLLIRDFDGDKIEDVIVINNARSRIDLLLSSKNPDGDDVDQAVPKEKEVNEIKGDKRMRLVSVPVNKAIVSLQAGDFDGDGKPDLAYYGEPAGVEILYNKGNGRFGDVKKINTGDAVQSGGTLSVGDLDRDGRDDLALIAANEIVLVYQREKGKLSEPERLPHTLDNPRMVKIVDLDGNGINDLVMLNGSADDPIRVRFAAENGTHGPEERFFVEALRAYAFGQMDQKPGSELLMIENQSGRTRVLTLDTDDDDDAKRGRLSFYPQPPGSEQGRSLDVGDLDGDGKADVVVTDPAKAQFHVYRQSGKLGLGESKTFPSLVGGGPIKLGDLDGDGKAEVYIVSDKEKQLGRSLLVDDRLTFPAPLPTTGDPVALDLADLDGDKTPELLYVTRDKAEGSTRRRLHLACPLAREDRRFRPVPLGSGRQRPLEGDRRRSARPDRPRHQPRWPGRYPCLQRLRPSFAPAGTSRRAPRTRRWRSRPPWPASPRRA